MEVSFTIPKIHAKERPRASRRGHIYAPTREEVREYAKERKSATDPDRFFDYFEKRDWKSKGRPIYHWKSIFDIWDQKDRQRTSTKKHTSYIERPEVSSQGFGLEYVKGDMP